MRRKVGELHIFRHGVRSQKRRIDGKSGDCHAVRRPPANAASADDQGRCQEGKIKAEADEAAFRRLFDVFVVSRRGVMIAEDAAECDGLGRIAHTVSHLAQGGIGAKGLIVREKATGSPADERTLGCHCSGSTPVLTAQKVGLRLLKILKKTTEKESRRPEKESRAKSGREEPPPTPDVRKEKND
jgi:hypothetical protein